MVHSTVVTVVTVVTLDTPTPIRTIHTTIHTWDTHTSTNDLASDPFCVSSRNVNQKSTFSNANANGAQSGDLGCGGHVDSDTFHLTDSDDLTHNPPRVSSLVA